MKNINEKEKEIERKMNEEIIDVEEKISSSKKMYIIAMICTILAIIALILILFFTKVI